MSELSAYIGNMALYPEVKDIVPNLLIQRQIVLTHLSQPST